MKQWVIEAVVEGQEPLAQRYFDGACHVAKGTPVYGNPTVLDQAARYTSWESAAFVADRLMIEKGLGRSGVASWTRRWVVRELDDAARRERPRARTWVLVFTVGMACGYALAAI